MNSFLNGVNVLAVICTQFGDTGKGKFVDLFAEWADVIARGTGGANAGHTISLGGQEHIFHLVPSGILWDAHGKTNVIGNGVVLDPLLLCRELEMLERANISFKNLRISHRAKLVLPHHLIIDRLRESAAGSGKIGTTGKGISPAYIDHYRRIGLVVNDLLNPVDFITKLNRNLDEARRVLKTFDASLVVECFRDLGMEKFYHKKGFFLIDAIVDEYTQCGKFMNDMIADTDFLTRAALANKRRVLLEGAQGNLLSIDHGTYPFVTASDATTAGLAKGVGIRERDIDFTLGITKAPYMTRVGSGPFPTEMGGNIAASRCSRSGMSKFREKELFPTARINAKDELTLGVAIRRIGHEYGATTGRPRRVGWLDLPLLRYSTAITGRDIALTKVDVMSGRKTIKICTHYRYRGPLRRVGEREIEPGHTFEVAIPTAEILEHCEPVYEELPGWSEDISEVQHGEDLPTTLRRIIAFIEQAANVRVSIVSVGPDRHQTIFKERR